MNFVNNTIDFCFLICFDTPFVVSIVGKPRIKINWVMRTCIKSFPYQKSDWIYRKTEMNRNFHANACVYTVSSLSIS